MLFSEGSVTLVVKTAVRPIFEVGPYLCVAPVDNRKDPHELGPPGGALSEKRKITAPWVSPAVAHNNSLDALVVNQLLHFLFKIRAKQLNVDFVQVFHLLPKLTNFVELVDLNEMDVFEVGHRDVLWQTLLQ